MSARTATSAAPQPRYSFAQQRDALVGEIAVVMEHVLQNINKLNRSLEGVIAVGNEFGAVEALWSQFEGVMAKGEGEDKDKNAEGSQEVDEDEGRDGGDDAVEDIEKR